MDASDILILLIIVGIAYNTGYQQGRDESYRDGYVIGVRYGNGYTDGADGKPKRYPEDPFYVEGYKEGKRSGHPNTIFA